MKRDLEQSDFDGLLSRHEQLTQWDKCGDECVWGDLEQPCTNKEEGLMWLGALLFTLIGGTLATIGGWLLSWRKS